MNPSWVLSPDSTHLSPATTCHPECAFRAKDLNPCFLSPNAPCSHPFFTLTLLHSYTSRLFPLTTGELFRHSLHLYSFDHVPPLCYVAFVGKIFASLRG